MYRHHLLICLVLIVTMVVVSAKKAADKPDWAKKDIRDFSDADMERLLDQWDEDEDPLPDDELPEHLRPQPEIDFSKLDMNDPEKMLQATKKGKTLMAFVTVSGNPTKSEAESITQLWQTSLWNNQIQAERYMIDDNRALFSFNDGSQAWIAKDFLVTQEHCESVTIENKVYDGIFVKRENEKNEL